jgi:hypothetical protein
MRINGRWVGLILVLCTAIQTKAQDCRPTETKLSVSPHMLQWDNQGQTFVSGLYQDNLTVLLESSRQWTVCKTLDLGVPARLSALGTQAFLAFRLQFANAYVLHEYAHAESALRLQLAHVRVGTNDGNPIAAAPYLSNLTVMAFELRQIGDLSRRGVSVAWDSNPKSLRARTQTDAAGLNLNAYLAWHSFESMLHSNPSASQAMGYTVNKWFSPIYFEMDQRIGGDPSAYVEDLAAQGIYTGKSEIQQVQLLAALLSNGVWTSARNLLQYGDTPSGIAPLHWTMHVPGSAQGLSIYWPEFSSYLNQQGVSFGGDMSLSFGTGALWTLGLERNTIGLDQGTDLSLGLRKAFDPTTLSGRITLNQGHAFASIKGEYRLNPQVSLLGLLYATQGDTLVGQRLAFRSSGGGYLGLNIHF